MSCIRVRLFLGPGAVRSQCVRALCCLPLPELQMVESGPADVGLFEAASGTRGHPPPAATIHRLIHPLLLSPGSSPRDCVCAVLRGAHGLVRYGEIERELAQAVQALAAGKSWFPVKGLPAINSLHRARSYGRFGLTEQEWKALALASAGLLRKQVGDILGITERTTGFHLDNAYRKLGIHSRQQIRRLTCLLFG